MYLIAFFAFLIISAASLNKKHTLVLPQRNIKNPKIILLSILIFLSVTEVGTV